MNILVTGATGYIGGRLAPRLLEKGYRVRCMIRDPDRAVGRWPGSEIVAGDVHKPETLKDALRGIDIAYYLIHSMAAGEKKFVDLDLTAARNFSQAAREQGVRRIIYLGGLGTEHQDLSPHLKSRQDTGEQLRSSGTPVTEFRAGMIVGSGSLSFEMVRYLTERLPVMICPKWVMTRTQPIAIRDVLRYLIETLDRPETENQILEIGGEDVLTYGELMLVYAKVRGLRRHLIHVPLLTPHLSSYWVDLVTPIPHTIARPLIHGLKNELICHDPAARKIFPFSPMTYEAAVTLALERESAGSVETVWSGAMSSIPTRSVVPMSLEQKEGMMIEKRELLVRAPPETVFAVISRVGGKNGWYANTLWQLRGALDRLVGGVGMRRGRRDANVLRIGDPLDFWRVEAIEADRLIRLRAEMKLPGKAWLQFLIQPTDSESSILVQTAFFEPRGLFGFLYWYSIYFLHGYIFGGMIRKLAREAEQPGSIQSTA